MDKKEIRDFFVNLKTFIDNHIESGTLVSADEVPKELLKACNSYIKAGTSPRPQFLNELYLSTLFYESCRGKTSEDAEFVSMTDKHYREKRANYEGLELEMFIAICLLNIDRILVEDYS